MNINIENIIPEGDKLCFRLTGSDLNGRNYEGVLTIALKHLYSFTNSLGGPAFDLFIFSSLVYGIDILVKREWIADDGWSRELSFVMPVESPDMWSVISDDVNKLLKFLTADYWDVSFVKRQDALKIPIKKYPHPNTADNNSIKSICLFSGGMDSFIGAIDLLESLKKLEKVVFISHYDGVFKGAKSDQDKTIVAFNGEYDDKYKHIQSRVDLRSKNKETTLRSRSFLFLSMSVYVASALKSNVPILLPENGTIALNHPLTPSRYSTCSTRTAHPHMVNELIRLLNKLNLPDNIHNPYEFKTKGDMVVDCKNIDVFKRGYLNTCSCAKRGTRKDIRENPNAKNCGVCMPCMYRRAALHRMALDVEPIGTNMLDPDDQVRSLLKIPDMPAFISFLKTNITKSDIEGNLLCNGSLPLDLIGDYADVVVGVRKEIMQWIIDKGGIAIKKELGL